MLRRIIAEFAMSRESSRSRVTVGSFVYLRIDEQCLHAPYKNIYKIIVIIMIYIRLILYKKYIYI